MKGVLHFCGHQTETKLQSIRVGGSDRRIFPWKFSDEIPPMDRFAGEESRARSKAVRPIESNGTPMTRPDQRLMIRDVTGLLFRAAVICFHQENFTIFDRKNLNVNFVIQVNRATSRFLKKLLSRDVLSFPALQHFTVSVSEDSSVDFFSSKCEKLAENAPFGVKR